MSGVRGGDNIQVAVKDKISFAKCRRIKQVMEDIKTEAELETLPQKVNEILNDNSTITKQIKVGDTIYDYVVDSDGCLVKIGNDEVPFKKDKIPSFKIEGDEYTEYSFENGEIKIIKKDTPKTEPQPAQPKPETVWDTSSPEALDRQLAVRLREMEKQKYDMDAYEALRKEIMELDIEHNVKLDLIDRLDLQEKSHRINPDPQALKAEPAAQPATTTETTTINGKNYKTVVDDKGNLLTINGEKPISPSGNVIEDGVMGGKVKTADGTEYTIEGGKITEVKEPVKTETTGFEKAEPAPNQGEHIGGEVEDPALVQANFAKDIEVIQHENNYAKLEKLEGEIDTDPAFEKYSDVQKQSLKNEIEHRKQEIKSIQDGMLNEEFKTRIKDVQDVSEYDAIREDILNSELSDTNKADLLRILEDDKNTRFPQRVVDDEAPVVEDEAIEEAPVEETFTPEELTGAEKIKNDEFNAVKKSIDDVVDNETYTAARERIENSSILTNEEKTGMMSMLDEAKGNFKPVTPSPVTPKTFGQKVGSARRATLGTLGFVAGAGLISSRLGSGDDSDDVIDEADEVDKADEVDEIPDETDGSDIINDVDDTIVDDEDPSYELGDGTTVSKSDIDNMTEEQLQELEGKLDEMSEEDRQAIKSLIDARRKALADAEDDTVDSNQKAEDVQEQEQTIDGQKVSIGKDENGNTVVKDKDGKVFPVNSDGTVTINGKKYKVKGDGTYEEIVDNNSKKKGPADKNDKPSKEFDPSTYNDRIQGKPVNGNKPEIDHTQVVAFTKAIHNAKTQGDLDNILKDIFTFKMFKGRKQLRTAIRAKRDAIEHVSGTKYASEKEAKVVKKSERAIERNVDSRKSFLGVRLGDKKAEDVAKAKLLIDEYRRFREDKKPE